MTDLSNADIVERLVPITSALAADGYELAVIGPDGGRITARITATENACPDCLVPKQVMTSLLAQALGQGGPTADEIDLLYPVEAH